MNLKGYFDETNGRQSMTRLLVFIACVTACLIAITQEILHAACGSERSVLMVGTLLTYAGGKKILQKYQERKTNEGKEDKSGSDSSRAVDRHASDS